VGAAQWRDDEVAAVDLQPLPVHFHLTVAVEQVVDLLGSRVLMDAARRALEKLNALCDLQAADHLGSAEEPLQLHRARSAIRS